MRIRAFASAIPDTNYDVDKIAEWCGVDPEFLQSKIGVVRRGFLGPNETGVSLAVRAVDELFYKTSLPRDSIELLIYVTQTPDYGIPQNSSLLQNLAGLPRSMASFDLGLGCSGYPYALTLAKGFMRAQSMSRAIIVTCDPYSKIMRREDKATTAVFGDAATATLLDNEGTGEIGLGDYGTDGSGHSALIVRAGSAASPIWSVHKQRPELDAADDDYRLRMNGRAVFDFVMHEIPGSLTRAIEKNRLLMGDIKWFALHQGSLYMLKQLAIEANLPLDRVLINIDRYGNTVSSSIPLLLEEQMATPEGLTGNVIISGFGVGLSWGSTALKFS